MECLRWFFRYGSWSPTKEQWLWALRHVQEEERERISRFAFQTDAKASLSGRLMLRKAVRDLTGLSNTSIYLTRSALGRPMLPVKPEDVDLDFNISHQGGVTVLAARPRCRVGVDVMRVESARGSRSASDFFRLMDRQFNDEEWACIRDAPTDAEQMRRFYRHWCLKESFVKADGRGIGYNLKSLHCKLYDLSDFGPFVFFPDQVLDEWQFEEHDIGCDHVAAIAWNAKEKVTPGHFVEVSICDLLTEEPLVTWVNESHWTNFCAKDVGRVEDR